MPALDRYHETVVHALEKDGWVITASPYRLRYAEDNLYIDIAAERLIAAEKGTRRIAVEIKGFGGNSPVNDLHQLIVYRRVLEALEPEREVYLAVPETARQEMFEDGLGALLLKSDIHYLLSFDPDKEEIIRWIP